MTHVETAGKSIISGSGYLGSSNTWLVYVMQPMWSCLVGFKLNLALFPFFATDIVLPASASCTHQLSNYFGQTFFPCQNWIINQSILLYVCMYPCLNCNKNIAQSVMPLGKSFSDMRLLMLMVGKKETAPIRNSRSPSFSCCKNKLTIQTTAWQINNIGALIYLQEMPFVCKQELVGHKETK